MGRASISVTVLRQILLLVPLAWVFHFQGLSYVWLTFPVTEMIALLFCARLYVKYPPEHVWDRKDTYNCRQMPYQASESRMRSIMLCFLKFFMMRYVSSSCMVRMTMIRTTVCAAG